MERQTYTNNQLKEIREVFDLFDTDKSGEIGQNELRTIIKSLNLNINDADIKTFIRNMDKNQNGKIEFSEFVEELSHKKRNSKKEIEQAFRHFDKDNSGSITVDEILIVMKKFHGSFNKQQLETFLKRIDMDGNGKIGIDEFMILLS